MSQLEDDRQVKHRLAVRQHYHFGPTKIAMYRKRYHDVGAHCAQGLG
jgi:hypothetical protein